MACGKEEIARHKRRIDEMDRSPKQRMQQIITAIIAGCVVSVILGAVLI